MPIRSLQLDLAFLVHENGVCLAIPPRYPELSALGRQQSVLVDPLARLAGKLVRDLDALEIHRRQPSSLPEVVEARIELEPAVPKDGASARSAWTEPVELRFHYLLWDHGNVAAVAYVPLLDIAVVAEERDLIPQRVEREILFALRREKWTGSLRDLCRLQRIVEVSVERAAFEADVQTPKQIAIGEEEPKKSALGEVATNLRSIAYPPVFERDALVKTLAENLTGRTARSVLLVGPSGVGKTALVHELYRRRGDHGLEHTPFWTTSGARIVAGMCGFGMWQQRCQAICREAAKTKAIVHLGNLMELIDVGKSVGNDEAVAGFLRPYLERSELLAIAECTVDQQTVLERVAPGLLSVFAVVQVEQPTARTNRAILRKTAAVWCRSRRARLDGDALKTLDRFHQRYCTYSAMPGRPLRFLHNLIEAAPRGSTITAADVTAAFSRETGLPHVLLDEQEPLDVESVRGWLARQVVGQSAAVDVVVDLLAAVKAALTQPQRPIASLLFIGPTGVGKTEMARSLAEFLYRDRRRMVRIDMSEYADPLSIDRLIGGIQGEGVLTAKVREQPFGVVLLDEFEKAHSRFFDLLLQVLGEGRLTDAAGRLADFRNSVIIMTSNLGSESFGRGQIGLKDSHLKAPAAVDHFRRAVQETVRPELFNRIDRIVPFLPLSQDTLLEIARRKLELLKHREGIRFRNVRLAFSDSVAEEVVRLGYDPRYGARPIDRVIDRQVLAPLAAALNDYQGQTALEAAVDSSRRQIRVRVRAAVGDASSELRAGPAAEAAARAVNLRRDACLLLDCRAVGDLRTQFERIKSAELYRRRKQARLLASGRILPPPDPRVLEQMAVLERLLERIQRAAAKAAQLEEQILIALYERHAIAAGDTDQDAATLKGQLDALYLDLFHRSLPLPDRILLPIYSPSPRPSRELARAYLGVARDRGYRARGWRIVRGPVESVDAGRRVALKQEEPAGAQKPGPIFEAIREDNPESLLEAREPQDFGMALELHGHLANALFATEAGRHRFIDESGPEDCVVQVWSDALSNYSPPPKVHMRSVLSAEPLRRVYDEKKQHVEDKATGKAQYWKGKQLGQLLDQWLGEQLMTAAKDWVHAD